LRYYANYQYRPADHPRPIDDGTLVDITSENGELILLPNVGDYVEIPGEANLTGIVETRLFSYVTSASSPENPACIINIVVGDTGINWGRLSKA
jgi:hypothetical protein